MLLDFQLYKHPFVTWAALNCHNDDTVSD